MIWRLSVDVALKRQNSLEDFEQDIWFKVIFCMRVVASEIKNNGEEMFSITVSLMLKEPELVESKTALLLLVEISEI